MKKNDTVRINIPDEQARLFRECYRPVVKAAMETAAYTWDLDAVFLSVYLQGVQDGAQVALPGVLTKGESSDT